MTTPQESEQYTARQLVIIGHGGGAMVGLLDALEPTFIRLLDPMLLVPNQRGHLELHDVMFPTKRLEVHNGFTLFRFADLEDQVRSNLQEAYLGAMTKKRSGLEIVSRLR